MRRVLPRRVPDSQARIFTFAFSRSHESVLFFEVSPIEARSSARYDMGLHTM